MVNKLRGAYQTMCEELSSNGHSQIEKKNNRAFYRIPDLKVNHKHELQDVSTREFLSIEVIWTIPLQQPSLITSIWRSGFEPFWDPIRDHYES